MYSITQTDYGYKWTFSGELQKEEMAGWLEESERILAKQEGSFSVFVDMQSMQPASQVVQKFFQRGQILYGKRGMVRSVVILSNPALSMQFKRIAVQSGIYEGERYIDSSTNADWEEVGLGWVVDALEPTAHTRDILVNCP